ncbi:MAG: FliM/FliN family flagellar motor switch protein [Campylobacterota bacterium]|nr:FliM/FliN family flagellar motor switch protein [Campylobacterota bacterium]
MASDLSNIIKNEIVSTLESLLSVSGSVEDVLLLDDKILDSEQCIKVTSQFEFGSNSSAWDFYIPTATATKFEYLMLGGIADLKDSIDDEISDAVKEIISTISGSITTSVNAQGFEDISGMKFSLGDSGVIRCSEESNITQVYKILIQLNEESLVLYLAFDDVMVSYISNLTSNAPAEQESTQVGQVETTSTNNSVLSSLLGEESVDNLRLLFDIKLRLSVRLGTKVCLLRDVISWDIGEIIELTQMTNEPLEILVNGVVIGDGEAVIVDGKFGVKIKNIGEPKLN